MPQVSRRRLNRLAAAVVAVTVAAAYPAASPTAAEPDAIAALLGALDGRAQDDLRAYRAARAAHEAQSQAFWADVADRKAERRRKRAAREPLTAADFVAGVPPVYAGPAPSKDVQAILAEEEKRDPPKPIATVADALAAAQATYGFVPERVTEFEFKRRYAIEALALGLTRDQVVRVYALETGGIGTADMQSGINPVTGQGRAISSALGYAQLLNANSIDELVRAGDGFVARLSAMANRPGVPVDRRQSLVHKAAVVQAMLARARSVPNAWAEHVKYAGTEAGLGIHTLNLDGDIGPWLQVIKLKGLKLTAEASGRPQLSGAEIEMMNLVGPATGLEAMSTPVARQASMVNFFARGGYERNSMAKGKTVQELLVEFDRRMDLAMAKPGAIEFNAAFDAVLADRR